MKDFHFWRILQGKALVEMDPIEKIRMEDTPGLTFKTFSGTISGFIGGMSGEVWWPDGMMCRRLKGAFPFQI